MKQKIEETKEYKRTLKNITDILKPLHTKAKKMGLEQCPKCTMFCSYKTVLKKGKEIKKYYCPDCEKVFYLKP